VLKADHDLVEEHEGGIHRLTLSYYHFYLYFTIFFVMKIIIYLLLLYIIFNIHVSECLRKKDYPDMVTAADKTNA